MGHLRALVVPDGRAPTAGLRAELSAHGQRVQTGGERVRYRPAE